VLLPISHEEKKPMTHLTRRQALHTAAGSLAALALAPVLGRAQVKPAKKGPLTLPKLPYATDALEPHIDARTMEIHHQRHHQAYIDAANAILEKHENLAKLSVDALLAELGKEKSEVPAAVKQALINSVGGHSNHSIFWEIMGPKAGGKPGGELSKAIEKQFGNYDKFQQEFSNAGLTQFGSGWAWLVVTAKGELAVVKKANQDSPIMEGSKPLLGLDVWEHAYYLVYQNRRPDYVAAWWNVVAWNEVARRYDAAKKK